MATTTNIIKKTLLFCSSIIVILFNSNCSKSDLAKPDVEQVQEYQINTLGFSDITSNQVKLTGQIKIAGNETVLDHGFIIQEAGTEANSSSEINISLGKTNQVGEISTTFKSPKSFDPNVYYTFYFYVRTEKNFIKGNLHEFALNSLSIIPNEKRFSYGRDTIHVNGNFENLGDKFRIRVRGAFELFSLPFTLSADKKVLSFVIGAGPEVSNFDEIQISLVRKNENPKSYVQDLVQITYLAKVVFERAYHDFLTPLKFKVENIADSYYGIKNLFILINGKKIPYNNNLYLRDHPEFGGKTLNIGYMNGKDSVYFSEPYNLIQPSSDDPIIPHIDRVHPNTLLNFNAKQLHHFFWAYVSAKLGNEEVEARFDYRENLLGIHVGDLPEGEYDLTVYNQFHFYNHKNKIKVEKLKISTKGPYSTYIGDTIQLKGNFIKGLEYFVINQNNDLINSAVGGENEIKLEVISGFEGVTAFKFISSDEYYKELKSNAIAIPYKSLGYTIDKFYPTSGTTGDVLTIEGKGIGCVPAILLGDTKITPIKINNHKISFSIPRLPGKGKMKISISSVHNFYQSDNYFEYL